MASLGRLLVRSFPCSPGPSISVLRLLPGAAVTLPDQSSERAALAVDKRELVVAYLRPCPFHVAAELLPTAFADVVVHRRLQMRWTGTATSFSNSKLQDPSAGFTAL